MQYLGERRWAVSAVKKWEIIIACPAKTTQASRTNKEIRPIGIVELPTGCSGHSNEWVFPALEKGSLTIKHTMEINAYQKKAESIINEKIKNIEKEEKMREMETINNIESLIHKNKDHQKANRSIATSRSDE